MLKSAVSLAALTLTIGCASPPHVVVTVPTKGASHEKRVEAYDSFQATSKHGLGVTQSQRKDHMVLADGRKVHYPGDLYHAVNRDSRTDYAMGLHDRYKSGAKAVRYLGYAAAAAGAVMLGVGAATSNKDTQAGTLVVGGAAVVGGVGVALIGGGILDEKAGKQRERAFAAYNKDLAERLGLCIASNGVPVKCAEEPAKEPASAEDTSSEDTSSQDGPEAAPEPAQGQPARTEKEAGTKAGDTEATGAAEDAPEATDDGAPETSAEKPD